MEVMTYSTVIDFNVYSVCTSPSISAPSSPHRFGSSFFFSAPTSPTGNSDYFHGGDSTSVPFKWEEKPGIPKNHISTAASSNYGDAEQDELEEIDFAFHFSGQFIRNSLPADELFDGGKIKPLKPPPRFQYDLSRPLISPKSPVSPKKLIKEALSPRHRKKDFDPFAAALEETRKESVRENANETRGRERTISNSSTSPKTRNQSSRSLSPFRVSNLLLDHEPNKNPPVWYKKWKIKDLLLFRSASESRATDSDQLKKYNLLKKTREDHDDVRNSSFQSSTDSVGSVSGRRRSGVSVSAHALHYKIDRAVSEEMKKRTFLPCKQGLLGCLGFQPTVPELSKGIGSAG